MKQMEAVEAEITKINAKLDVIDLMLKKPLSQWTEDEKEEFGSKDQLREEKEMLRDEKKDLRKKEEQVSNEVNTGIVKLIAIVQGETTTASQCFQHDCHCSCPRPNNGL